MTRGVAAQLAREALAEAGLSEHLLPAQGARRALERRLRALGGLAAELYERRYRDDAAERQAYLEGLLTGETSFFRDAAVFADMRRWCLAWLARNAATLRILSAPCSTGEEPYSLAAMLLEAGVEPGRFTVEALDVSVAALAEAQAGVYGGLALRNLAAPAECWFLQRAPGGWAVREDVRRCVAFRQANLMEADPLSGAKYDLICCRNLLIYQTAAARAHTAGVLQQALAPGGRVVLGSADWCRELGEHFVLEQPVQSFALRAREVLHIAEPAPAPQPAEAQAAVSEREIELTEHYRQALEAYQDGAEERAEWLCRQALYLDSDCLPALELLAQLRRPHVPPRHRAALRARLSRQQGEGE